MKVCESEIEKKRYFSFLKLQTRKINWWNSLDFWVLQPWKVGVLIERFCYWYCGEIVFIPWDCIYSLRFICCKSNLLWTQVWHKLESCDLYFIVDIFWNYPMVFPSILEGFPRKIWCSCVDVFLLVLAEILFL